LVAPFNAEAIMRTNYPVYYEDAAHIVRVLTDAGLHLRSSIPVHAQLLRVAAKLETFAVSNPSHADAGASIIDQMTTEWIDDRSEKRLRAIAGTLIGNFLLMHGRRMRKA
jgi:hypothetical protein